MSKRDIGASVRQRLLNQAHEQGRPFQELLQYFVMERFLYRLSKSQFRDSSDYPLTIAKIQFDASGHPQSGKVYPAVKVTVTPDGFVDIDTQSPDTATLIDIARSN